MKIKKIQLFALVAAAFGLTGVCPLVAQSIYEPYSFTTLAGSAGLNGTNDDTGAAARFDRPWGIAVDSAGNVYAADLDNHTIRKISPGGVVATLAGVPGVAGTNDGPGNSALFYSPRGLAVDGNFNVYVADYNNSTIRKITAAGVVSTLAGSPGVFGSADGTGSTALFNRPFAVAVNASGELIYVADTQNQTIRRITPGGAVTTVAGLTGVPGAINGANGVATFNSPRGIAVDSQGNVYVADTGNQTIRKILVSGGVSTLAGIAGAFGSADGTGSAALFSRLSPSGPFGGPNGLAVDGDFNVYVADQGNHTIRKINATGGVTTLAGLALNPGSDDGTGGAARFDFPAGVAVDNTGSLYVTDTLNDTIRTGVGTNCIQIAHAANKTVECGTDWIFDEPVATSCCGGDFKITVLSTVTNGSPCAEMITRTWQIRDQCGSTNFSSQTVTVTDTTPPTIECPANMTVTADGPAGVVVRYTVTAADNCGTNLNIVCSPPSCSTFPIGATAVVCTVFDACGNSNSCGFIITVVTNANPTTGVIFGGFSHGIIGGAVLSELPGGLLNVQPSPLGGTFGASVELGDSEGFRWVTDMATNAPVGATLVSQGWGMVDGVSGQLIYSVGLEVASGGTLHVQPPDFSNLGATTYTLRLFSDGAVVYEQSGLTKSPGDLINGTKTSRCCASLIPPRAYWLISKLAAQGEFAVNGGPVVLADEVDFLPDNPTRTADSLQRAAEEATGMDSFTLSGESIVVFGNEHSSDSSQVSGASGVVTVTSGPGGDTESVDIDIYSPSLLDLKLMPVDLTGTNTSFDFSVDADLPDDSEVPFGRITLAGNGPASLSLYADFGTNATDLITVTVLTNGVAAGATPPIPTGMIGPIVGPAFLTRCGVTGLSPRSFTLDFTQPVSLQLPGGNLTGTEFLIQSASAVATVTGLEDGTLATANIGGGFTILGESTASAVPGKLLGASRATSGAFMLTWDDPRDLLEQADTLNGPWSTLLDALSPYTVTTGGSSKFFRLRTGSLADNAGFSAGTVPGQMPGAGAVANWSATYGNPQVFNLQGDDDRGFVRLSGNQSAGQGIQQMLPPANRFKAGHNYQVSFSARYVPCGCGTEANYVKIRAVAFNGAFPVGTTAPKPATDLALIDVTGSFTDPQWTTVAMGCWKANLDFDSIALSAENDEPGACSSVDIDNVLVMEVLADCPCEDASVDTNGNVIFPDNVDTDTPPTYDDIDQLNGNVHDLYGQSNDTSTATWYPTNDLCSSIGGTVPTSATTVDLDQMFLTNGISITPEELTNYTAIASTNALNSILTNTMFWSNVTRIAPYTNVCSTKLPPGFETAFCGQDIVFVHGYRTDPLKAVAKFADSRPFNVWPAAHDEFYNNFNNNGVYGYWKQGADAYWQDHIGHFLTARGRKNRYITIAHAVTQGFEFGSVAMLTQIADAMNTGQGVVFDPSDPRGSDCFGGNGIVIVSHSDGALLSDIAMTLAGLTRDHSNPFYLLFGDVSYIPDHVTAHVALHGAFSGSRFATVLYGIASLAGPLEDVLRLMDAAWTGANFNSITTAVLNGETRDMVPLVAQQFWGAAVNGTPVKTITIAGGHPSAFGVESLAAPAPNNPAADIVKLLLLKGFDDGVTCMDSSTANPNLAQLGPSVYLPIPSLLNFRVYDMGINHTDPYRAIGYYLDQTLDPRLGGVPFGVSAGSVPYLSPSGMVQPVAWAGVPFRDALNRYNNHFSFLMTASDHFWGPLGDEGSSPSYYFAPNFNYLPTIFPTIGFDDNSEEVLAVSDRAIYQPPNNGHINISCPLVNPAIANLVHEQIKGRKVTFTVRIFHHRFSHTFWIWKRKYHLLDGYESKTECDYMYENVLN